MNEYTEDQWLEEMKAQPIIFQYPGGQFAFGTTLPCPACQTVGFYGPRIYPGQGEPTRKYRACKFCGFWQEAWGELRNEPFPGAKPYRCTMVRCETCNSYDWRFPDGFKPGTCPTCNVEMTRTAWPSEDPQHPYNQLKEQIRSLQGEKG